jgi:hypothetical protein
MAIFWDDDERSTLMAPRSSTPRRMSFSNEQYTPVWRILKEMYDEEKEAMYCDSQPNRMNNSKSTWDHLNDDYYCRWETLSSDSSQYADSEREDDDIVKGESEGDFEDDKAYHEDSMMYKNVYYV